MDQFTTPNPPINPTGPPRDFSGLKPPESMTSGPTRGTPGESPLKFPSGAPSQRPQAVPTPPATFPDQSKPRSPLAMFVLISFLLLILVAAILVFLSYKGMISLGGLERLWGGGQAIVPTPDVSITLAETTPTPESFDAQRKRDLATLQAALIKYFADNSKYPEATAEIKTSDTSSILAQALVPSYIAALPDDPLAPRYYYGYQSDGQSFQLTCVLEDTTDTSGVLRGNINIYTITDTSGE